MLLYENRCRSNDRLSSLDEVEGSRSPKMKLPGRLTHFMKKLEVREKRDRKKGEHRMYPRYNLDARNIHW